jgi:hypothetical protein
VPHESVSVREVTDKDREESALLCVVGALACDQLVDLLVHMFKRGAEEPPILLARTPFAGSTVQRLTVTMLPFMNRLSSESSSNGASAAAPHPASASASASSNMGHWFAMEITGPLLPHVVRELHVCVAHDHPHTVRWQTSVAPEPGSMPALNRLMEYVAERV